MGIGLDRYLCICICEKKRGKKEEVCWGSVLICRPICQSHSPGAIARNTSAHQRIQIQRATFPLQIQLGILTSNRIHTIHHISIIEDQVFK